MATVIDTFSRGTSTAEEEIIEDASKRLSIGKKSRAGEFKGRRILSLETNPVRVMSKSQALHDVCARFSTSAFYGRIC